MCFGKLHLNSTPGPLVRRLLHTIHSSWKNKGCAYILLQVGFKPKVKTVAEKLSFKLRIWPGHLVMDILKSSQLVIFSHSTIFITFSYRSLAGFLFKLYEVRGGENRNKWRWIFAFDRCVGSSALRKCRWPLTSRLVCGRAKASPQSYKVWFRRKAVSREDMLTWKQCFFLQSIQMWRSTNVDTNIWRTQGISYQFN